MGPSASPYTGEYQNLRFVAATKATLTVGTRDREYQICQVGFSRKDGSILVSFPYLPKQAGLLSIARFPENQTGEVTLSFAEGAKSTSHLVKYSHHPDGTVLFSQDRLVKSVVRRTSFRLDGPIGHLFQMSVYWPAGFEPFDPQKRRSHRAYLRNIFDDRLPGAVQVRGEWRRKASIVASIQPSGEVAGPVSKVQSRRTGDEFIVHFLGEPKDYPLQDHVLLLTVSPTRELVNMRESSLIFLGGYDHHERQEADSPVRHTACLVALYPASTHEELARRVESIDYRPT